MAKRKTCGDQALDPEKAGAGKAPHHCETAHDGQAAYRYQAPDKCQIGRVRSGYRLLRLTAPETWRGAYPNRATGNDAGRGAGRTTTTGRYACN